MDTKDKIIKWFITGDSGISSIAIVSQMTGNKTKRDDSWPDYPHDDSDFARCYNLLEMVPEFKERIGEMAQRSPQWAVLVRHWEELTEIYLSGYSVYKRINKILDPVR